ncbi:NAD(P)H-binding protein [Microbispora sp. RL4-1S]|uniref:NAD(P)H-binding protein n=1 Tax=Microbispora oryzae TaxID=2806554 RepID=A0A941AI95_9ACTN|nr:NAD(P)H-binding protein [Microbispora oryzae]MBP2702928.1 NAD(P)H-binding protein [Microbispora oryzae]
MIVVTGATGNVGRPLVHALAQAGEPVTAVSRRPAELPEGVRHRQADLADPDGLRPVLDGADALFLLVAGEDPQAILGAAKAGGVRRIVLLSTQGAGGRTYELTGPAPITPRQRAQAIGDALDAPIRFIEQSRDEARAQMAQFMPEPVVDGPLAILGDPLPAEQRVSLDVQKILGRAPRTFADWAARNVAAFI